MNHTPTTDLASRARELYRRAGPRVDPATATRLRAIRRQALDARPAQHPAMRWMVPTGAFAVALLAVVGIWQPLRHSPPVATPAILSAGAAASSEALPPDASQTDPALYQNLDFYAWLANQPAAKPRSGH